ncbi:MAG: hypothetical protein R3F56_12520 [Planctomycetota bacterium]
MMAQERIEQASEIMRRFWERTGADEPGGGRRYLWTDAFAVCNLLGLERATGDPEHGRRAHRLVDAVHTALGHHRSDDSRRGWLSGLPEVPGRQAPTSGGLRIGKALPERPVGVAADERLEWQRDGQYFHYLTKWMHALDQMARFFGASVYAQWARELMAVAHRAFTHAVRGGAPGVYWKMSIDLSRPQVRTMGHHDPLDGLVTALELAATARRQPVDSGPQALPAAGAGGDLDSDLDAIAADFEAMVDRGALATTDPLGLGGLLGDACRLRQLATRDDLRDDILTGALHGLRHSLLPRELAFPAEQRLAFRELGLAIGLASVARMVEIPPVLPVVQQLAQFLPLRAQIESYWLRAEARRARTWLAHEDINEVMLATSLLPEGFLDLTPSRC